MHGHPVEPIKRDIARPANDVYSHRQMWMRGLAVPCVNRMPALMMDSGSHCLGTSGSGLESWGSASRVAATLGCLDRRLCDLKVP